MNQLKKHRHNSLFLCQAGLIAAIYTVLTVFVGALGLANGAIQFRISEALCVLPFFTAAAIPGLTVGCLISNLLMSCIWQDVVFGTLATLIGALGAYGLRRLPWLVPLPTVLSNTLIIPPILAYGYHMEGAIPFLMLTVGIGEVLSAYLCGMLLLLTMRRYNVSFFR
ncbi:MAG: QueT transporter family protein [Ruminococcaceae bacterium]|nr:QueT transporter family protein [Oscillospiraceae bacterium]